VYGAFSAEVTVPVAAFSEALSPFWEGLSGGTQASKKLAAKAKDNALLRSLVFISISRDSRAA
jgi:hypothetical protein